MPLQRHEIPIVVKINDYNLYDKDISTGIIYETTSSGIEEVFTDFSTYDTGIATTDVFVEICRFNKLNDTTDIVDEFKIGVINSKKDLDINIDVLTSLLNQGLGDFEVSLFFNDVPQLLIDDSEVEFKIAIGTIPVEKDTDVDMYISGIKRYYNFSDIYCSTTTISNIDSDIQQGSGWIYELYTDLCICASGTSPINTDIYSTTCGSGYLSSDIVMGSGILKPIKSDIFSTCLGLSGISTDIKTRSLFTGDFFLERDRFTTSSSIAWVDIIDYLYPINIGNTNLYVDGVLASGVYFEDITNGQRMYYDPLDNFYSDGVIDYFMHAENSMGEVEEKNFYLLYGYDLKLRDVINWGDSKRVVVRATAQNLAYCPNIENTAFEFSTKPLSSVGLKAIIRPIEVVDLSASIFPQSPTFFYGETYIVKVKGIKDFAGNIMSDFEYTFTIEDPLK